MQKRGTTSITVVTGLLQLLLTGLAVAGGRLVGIDALQGIAVTWKAALQGIAASVPLLAFFSAIELGKFRFVRENALHLRAIITSIFPAGKSTSRARVLATALLLGTVAGVGEEIVFRGFLQRLIERKAGVAGGVALSAAVFGACHAVTPTYALLAGLAGAFMSCVWMWSGHNLLVPIVAHSFYDFVAIVAAFYRVNGWRRRKQ